MTALVTRQQDNDSVGSLVDRVEQVVSPKLVRSTLCWGVLVSAGSLDGGLVSKFALLLGGNWIEQGAQNLGRWLAAC